MSSINYDSQGNARLVGGDGVTGQVAFGSPAAMATGIAAFFAAHPEAALPPEEKDNTSSQLSGEDFKRAFALVLIDEFALVAGKLNAVLAAVQAATSLADLKTRCSSITNMPTRTLDQLKTALRNKLDG